MSTPASPPRIAFQYRDFRVYQTARLALTLAITGQSVAVGWQLYELTSRPLDLGLLGLVHFVPLATLALVGGSVADRYDRVRVSVVSLFGFTICALILWGTTRAGLISPGVIYTVMALFGAARAFSGPATISLLTHMVPERHFSNAVAWNGTTSQIGMVAGPVLAGVVYAAFGGAEPVYATSAGLSLVAIALLGSLHVRPGPMDRRPLALSAVLDGVRFVWKSPILLGVMSLDLFVVLFGGATALLPVYARDILHTGPWGLGMLRGAPGLGAACTAAYVAGMPIRRAGRVLFAAVSAFGLFTVAFGVSSNFGLSLAALVLVGAADMVAAVIRMTLVQVHTPPEMRGRVSAVNQVFIGASNELGEFESGTTAWLVGPKLAVVFGGLGAIAVSGLWAWMFPVLRQIQRFDRAYRKETEIPPE